jgi:hypothetical protein
MKKIIYRKDNIITRTLPTEIPINKLVYSLYNIRKNFIETGKIEEDEVADLIEKIKKTNVFKTLEELESELTFLDTLNDYGREEYFYS